MICPPTPYIAGAAEIARNTGVIVGAQNCCAMGEDCARTGEASGAMLADTGARYVIFGHSERRAMHHESDQLVAEKAQAALGCGVTPIVCVGETQAQREAGETATP